MLPVQTGFIDALRYGAFLVEARITVYINGAPATQYVVPVSTGTVTVDRNAEYRRQGSITVEVVPSVPPPAILPTSPTSVLAPFGNEVFIETGIAAAGGPTYWVPLGLFAIATVEIEDSTIDLTMTMDVYDRSWTISQRAFKQPYNFPAAGGNFVAEMEALLNQVWAENPNALPLTYNIVPTTATVPVASYNQGGDPWQAALDMAAAVGYELYFDVNGVVTGHPIPDPTQQAPVWLFTDDSTTAIGIAEGHTIGASPYTTPVSVAMTMTRDRIQNDFLIVGSSTQTQPGGANYTSGDGIILAEAEDSNPSSPTYVGGGLGDIPNFTQSQMISGSAQAQAAADNLLAASLSQAWQITVETPPNPAFDIDDVYAITNSRLGLSNRKVVIDTIQHVIRYDATMQVNGRVIG